jgi:ligand-binding SRPBCC domain-containing protein
MSQHKKRHGLRRLILLLLGSMALQMSLRRWAASFHTSSLTQAEVAGPDGRRIGRRVVVQSVLDAPPDRVWALVKQPATFARVVSPLIGFTVAGGRPLPQAWRPNDTVTLNLRGFGLIPLGTHAITIHHFDEAARTAETREHGALTPIWNHTIRVQPHGDSQTLYTDQVDLDAGPLNPLAGPFALLLFQYRQTRWKSLV